MGRLLARIVSIALRVCVIAVIALGALILAWRYLPAVSTLMAARWVTGQNVERVWLPLEKISPALIHAVLTSEDARFCDHGGVDWGALKEVLDEADEDGPSRGASTIPMQTVKNLFLWPGRSAIRKGLEIPLAMALDTIWPKRRVLEVYLNIAEWGDGVFGAEAAARSAFGKSAGALNAREAALLAVSLPNPILRTPGQPSARLNALASRLSGRVSHGGVEMDCLK